MPESRIPGAYTLSVHRAHHWLQPHWAALLELLFYRVWNIIDIPRPQVPIMVADCSTADGETPGEFSRHKRHPKNAHDDGANFDLTYPQTGPGPQDYYAPGRVVSTKYGPRLEGKPYLLASRYFAALFGHLCILDREHGGLFRVVAVDKVIEKEIKPRVEGFELEPETHGRAEVLFNSDEHISWRYHHHTHTHWRMQVKTEIEAARIERALRAEIEEEVRRAGVFRRAA